ncbi:MAG: phospholipase D-like domain-containing protein [Deltaproteobacteria bacterium]|nr:phospholipase D-like domain-containing protein [Deltaproteobacteria bacterium]
MNFMKISMPLLFVLMFLFNVSCNDEGEFGTQILNDSIEITDIGYEAGITDVPLDVSTDNNESYDAQNEDVPEIKDTDFTDISDLSDSWYLNSPQLVNNKDYLPLLKKIIQNARQNIIILHQEFLTGATLDQLQNDLADAKKRGVDIRILLEKDVDGNKQRVDSLKSSGIDAALDSSSKTLHLKLVLSDNKHLLLGSTNFSYSSFQFNNEVNIYVNENETVSKFYEYANAILSDNSKTSKIYCAGCSFTPIGDAQYADIVVPLINKAGNNVYVIMYQYSYDIDSSTPNGKITKALTDAKSRGASVKILLEYSSFDSTLNSANQSTSQYLKGKGIDVRMDSKDIVTHAKLLIADDVVVVYSGNWVYSALTSNHEIGLVINDPGVKNSAVNYFNALFNSAK